MLHGVIIGVLVSKVNPFILVLIADFMMGGLFTKQTNIRLFEGCVDISGAEVRGLLSNVLNDISLTQVYIPRASIFIIQAFKQLSLGEGRSAT